MTTLGNPENRYKDPPPRYPTPPAGVRYEVGPLIKILGGGRLIEKQSLCTKFVGFLRELFSVAVFGSEISKCSEPERSWTAQASH